MISEDQGSRRRVRGILLLLVLVAALGVLCTRWWGELGSFFSAGSESLVADPVLATLRDAEQAGDPNQRCLSYPQPRGVEWPEAVVEAFCADAFTPIIAYRTIENRIADGRALEVDAMFDRRVEAYFEGELAEQTFYNSYTWNFEHSNTSVRRLVDQWLEQSPDSAHAWTALGLQLLSVAWESRGPGHYSELPRDHRQRVLAFAIDASEALETALKQNPRIMAAYDGLLRAGPLGVTGSQWAFERAVAVDESGYYFRSSRLRIIDSRRLGSGAEIRNLVREAEPLIPANPRLVNLRALALHREITASDRSEGSDSYEEVMPYWERAVAQGPRGGTLDHAAHAATKLGDFRRAAEFLSQILRFNPENHRIRRRRVRMLMQLEEFDWALEELRYLQATTPKDAWPQRRYAEVLIRVGNYDEAEHYFLHQLEADPDDEWMLHHLVNLYIHHHRRLDRAGEVTTDWVRRMPESGAAWMLHAQYLKMSGNPGVREAMEEFLRFGDESSASQGRMMAEARQWLAENPESGAE